MKSTLLVLFTLAALPGAALAQFTDTFDTINPAWVTNRYAPAGFASVNFDGNNRLQLTIDQSGSTTNRPVAFNAEPYNEQGRERPAASPACGRSARSSTFRRPSTPRPASSRAAISGPTLARPPPAAITRLSVSPTRAPPIPSTQPRRTGRFASSPTRAAPATFFSTSPTVFSSTHGIRSRSRPPAARLNSASMASPPSPPPRRRATIS